MQIKKQQIKSKLLEAGEKEFFERGFQGASVRSIAKSAGTTLGNFYNYFSNKEELFNAVVNGEVEKFSIFMGNHQDGNNDLLYIDSEDPVLWYKTLGEYSGMFLSVFTRKFYILVSCSNGTGHQNSRETVIEYIKEHFAGHTMEQRTGIPELERTAMMLANGFLDGVLYILKNNEDEGVIAKLLRNHMLFFFMGTLGIIKGCSEVTSND